MRVRECIGVSFFLPVFNYAPANRERGRATGR
jgi:hypothetical protein